MKAMRRCFAIFALLPTLLAADDHWIKFTGAPFEVFSNAGPRAGREAMVRFQEFRHALGQLVGENDLQTPEPIRIMVFKNPQGWASSQTLIQARDRYAIVLGDKAGPNPALYRELVRLF